MKLGKEGILLSTMAEILNFEDILLLILLR